MKKPGRWKMWAHKENDGRFSHASPSKRWVEMHGLDEPVVQVEVVESATGEYYGWIDAKSIITPKPTGIPEMIWIGKSLFEICFPYGSKAEEDRGRGRVVRLNITEAKS